MILILIPSFFVAGTNISADDFHTPIYQIEMVNKVTARQYYEPLSEIGINLSRHKRLQIVLVLYPACNESIRKHISPISVPFFWYWTEIDVIEIGYDNVARIHKIKMAASHSGANIPNRHVLGSFQ